MRQAFKRVIPRPSGLGTYPTRKQRCLPAGAFLHFLKIAVACAVRFHDKRVCHKALWPLWKDAGSKDRLPDVWAAEKNTAN